MFKCPDRHLLRRRNFNFSGRVSGETEIYLRSTVSEILANLHAEFRIVRDSQTEDPRMQFVYACLFVVRALRSLRPARTCATKLLRDFNLHLQPSMPRS